MSIYEIADDMKSTQAEIDDGATYPDGGPYDLAHLAARILAAHERDIGVMRRELAAKDTEIARLTAALKPVLDCVFVHEPGFGVKTSKMHPCFNALKVVEECRSIYESWNEDNGHSLPDEGSRVDRTASGSDCENSSKKEGDMAHEEL